MDGKLRHEIHSGLVVEVVLKRDQASGKRTRGVVQEILTRSPTHPRGIKVRLTNGDVGRVQAIPGQASE
ncbi:MAG TPA: YwbE family protein [Thermoanaerobaculia bacterium]|nr:YwbE family protein [Thermoanaerobaculia bacterium]